MGPVQATRLTARELGREGERIAVSLLRARGFELVGQGFLARRGEIDLLCRRRGELFIFEVKARTSTAFGLPAEAVGPRKRRALNAAAGEYRALAGWRGPIRYGIVALVLEPSGAVRSAEVLEDPF